jgi:hypothetical protein
MTADPHREERRRRQRSRSIILAWLLVGFAILMFAITIARMAQQQ